MIIFDFLHFRGFKIRLRFNHQPPYHALQRGVCDGRSVTMEIGTDVEGGGERGRVLERGTLTQAL